METTTNTNEQSFRSWTQALHDNQLSDKQLSVLQEIVTEGKVEKLEQAAQLLDWQEMIINRPQHMYGL